MNEVANTITVQSKFKLPAVQSVRESIAKTLGFETISAVREVKKGDPRMTAVKEYAKKVRESAEIVDVETTYPNVLTVPAETVQELIASISRSTHRSLFLSARRKGEELPVRMAFNIFDLMETEDAEDEGEYDKDNILIALDAFCKARNLNETSAYVVQVAIVGSKMTMLKLRKHFNVLQEAQDKFASWHAANGSPDVDFDALAFWMKRQEKYLKSAMATPEIEESEISI